MKGTEGRHTASDDYKATQEEDRDDTPLLFPGHLESCNLRNGEANDCLHWVRRRNSDELSSEPY